MRAIQLGNGEVDAEKLLRAGRIAGGVTMPTDRGDTVVLDFTREMYTRSEVQELAAMLGFLAADEITIDGDTVRLWWD